MGSQNISENPSFKLWHLAAIGRLSCGHRACLSRTLYGEINNNGCYNTCQLVITRKSNVALMATSECIVLCTISMPEREGQPSEQAAGSGKKLGKGIKQ